MPVAEIAMGKIVESNKSKMVRSEAEIKVESHSHSVESPAESDVENRRRRDGRPTAIDAGPAPGDPPRTPNVARRPNPAPSMMQLPPAIMEWRPAPRIIGFPVPAAI